MGPVVHSTQSTDHMPGYYQDINSSMLHELWLALAAGSQPDMINRSPRLSLDELFSGDLLKNVTWSEFWKLFPHKMADCGGCLDDIDALGLLLASPVSKQRFERYFDEHARLNPGSDSIALHGTSLNRQQALATAAQRSSAINRSLQQQEPHNRLLHPISPFEQNQLPVRRRPPVFQPLQQLLQQQQALVYQIQPPAAVAGVAPYAGPHGSRLQSAAQPALSGAAADHFAAALQGALVLPSGLPDPNVFSRMVHLVGIAMDRSGTGAAGRAPVAQDALAVTLGRAVASVAPGPRMPTAAGAAAAATIGRRRSWLEACDPEGAAAQQRQQQQQAVAGSGYSALSAGSSSSAAPTAEDGVVNNASPPQHQQQAAVSLAATATDYCPVWRAVHDMLTSDDEAMLLTVSRLVPASIRQQLKDESEVKQQLQQLANVGPLPPQVVSGLADRMSSSSDIQLLRITTSSGYSRRAVAAAAALEASSTRRVCYIPMAGCHREDEVEAAILQGIFSSEALRNAPVLPPESLLRLQQQSSGEAAEGNGPVDTSMAAAGSGAAAASAEAAARQARQHVVSVLAAPRPLLDGDQNGTAGEDSEEDYYDSDNDLVEAEQRLVDWRQQLADGHQQLVRLAGSPPGAASGGEATAVVGLPHGMFDMMHRLPAPLAGRGGSRGGSAGAAEVADHLNAFLKLLGTCCKQPLLLLFDEVDMALIGSEDGLSFRDLLVQLMLALPQAQVVVTCSWDAAMFSDFRRQGQVVEYKLDDGTVKVGSYKVSRPLQYGYPRC